MLGWARRPNLCATHVPHQVLLQGANTRVRLFTDIQNCALRALRADCAHGIPSELEIDRGSERSGGRAPLCGARERRRLRGCGATDCLSSGLLRCPSSARESASSFPCMPTCEGTVIHFTIIRGDSISVSSSFQSSTLLSRPPEPTRLLSAHFLAFPVAPRCTRELGGGGGGHTVLLQLEHVKGKEVANAQDQKRVGDEDRHRQLGHGPDEGQGDVDRQLREADDDGPVACQEVALRAVGQPVARLSDTWGQRRYGGGPRAARRAGCTGRHASRVLLDNQLKKCCCRALARVSSVCALQDKSPLQMPPNNCIPKFARTTLRAFHHHSAASPEVSRGGWIPYRV